MKRFKFKLFEGRFIKFRIFSLNDRRCRKNVKCRIMCWVNMLKKGLFYMVFDLER